MVVDDGISIYVDIVLDARDQSGGLGRKQKRSEFTTLTVSSH
jgi:hypothetical protein